MRRTGRMSSWGVALTCALFLSPALPAQAAVHHVKADANGANDGTYWADAFAELQDALAAAEPGDEIWVAEGTYLPDFEIAINRSRRGREGADSPTHTGNRQLSFVLKSGVALYGGFTGVETSREQRDPKLNETTLSGDLEGDDRPVTNAESLLDDRNRFNNSSHVVIGSGVDETAILDGFTITGGAAYCGLSCEGGGMYNENGSPTVSNCIFSRNRGHIGGGMYNGNSSPIITNCTFSGNANIDSGAGMANENNSNPTLTNCTFTKNFSHGGSGIYNARSNPTLTNCMFSENTGVAMRNESSSPTLTNCTFTGNTSEEFSATGGMLGGGSSTTLTNCIFWGNRANVLGQAETIESAQIIGSTLQVSFSCIEGLRTFAGNGNIGGDPLFVDAANNDLRLRPGSPCIDAGDNAAIPPDTLDLDGDGDRDEVIPFDLDGNPRISGFAVDMGAYEAGDCNDNGVLDAQDIADGSSQDCTGNGIPDECEPDCNSNGIADSCDIAAGTSQDLNRNGVPTECEPELVHVMEGLGAAFAGGNADTFISPRAENIPFDRFTLQATEDLTLISASSTYTGPAGGDRRRGLPNAPGVAVFTVQEGGLHLVELDPAPAPGEWLKLSLLVRGASTGGEAVMNVWLAHHPNDINQDGTVDVRDATAFGDRFGNSGSPVLIDLNGDGTVDVRDATTFGEIWHGTDTTQPWNGHRLPDKPE